MKKVLFLVLSFFTIFALFACQKKEKPISQIEITVNEQIVKVNENTTINTIKKPTNESKAFDKWLVNGIEAKSDYKLKQGDKLIATWRDFKFFTVKFINTLDNPKDQLIREDKLITKPNNPIKKYYEFLGWYDNDKLFNFNEKINKDLTLSAKWQSLSAPKVNVKLNINGAIKEFKGYYASDLPLDVKDISTGYFSHWSINGEKVKENLELTEGQEITAEFKEYPMLKYRLYKKEILTDNNVNLRNSKTYRQYYVDDLPDELAVEIPLKINNSKPIKVKEYLNFIKKVEGYKIFAVISFLEAKKAIFQEIDGVKYSEIEAHCEGIKIMVVKK